MKQNDLLFWIWLAERLGAANRDFRKLITLYENPYDIFHMEDVELERVEGISKRTVTALSDKSLERANKIQSLCERMGIGVLPYGDPAYPHALREIQDPPVVLYYRGVLPNFQSGLYIAMVGTRKMSEYGLHTAYRLSYELASVGTIVVSGMAAGIDGTCAAAAIAAKGTTIAVLGCGIDRTYPKHHEPLKRAIEQNGVLLSEYPPKTPPNSYHFPERNRIISGLSRGTVVVEAGLKSGSLITAKDAIMQGRDVFAVPANVGSKGAEGTNGLLRDGAHLALCAEDILKDYQYLYSSMLRLGALDEAKQHTRPDFQMLEKLGVIELVQRSASRPSEPPKPTVPTSRRGRSKETAQARVTRETPSSPTPPPKKAQTPDEVLSSLTPIQLAILQAIPDNRAVTADSLNNLGYPYGDTVAALTMLEILGLVEKLPGALYTKS